MKSILEEALAVHEDRREKYGNAVDSFVIHAQGATNLLAADPPITPSMFCQLMIQLKLDREAHLHNRDNLVDICGYAHIAQLCEEAELGS